jgi:hypothetical protein
MNQALAIIVFAWRTFLKRNGYSFINIDGLSALIEPGFPIGR